MCPNPAHACRGGGVERQFVIPGPHRPCKRTSELPHGITFWRRISSKEPKSSRVISLMIRGFDLFTSVAQPEPSWRQQFRRPINGVAATSCIGAGKFVVESRVGGSSPRASLTASLRFQTAVNSCALVRAPKSQPYGYVRVQNIRRTRKCRQWRPSALTVNSGSWLTSCDARLVSSMCLIKLHIMLKLKANILQLGRPTKSTPPGIFVYL